MSNSKERKNERKKMRMLKEYHRSRKNIDLEDIIDENLEDMYLND